MLRKAGAVMIGNLIVDAHAQLTSALLLLTNAAIVQLLLRPFASSLWAALDTLSLCSLLATLVLSLMYLRWSTPANMCAGLSETDVLPGTVLTCAQVREEAATTERIVTVLLLGLHASVFAVFTVVFIRLWFVRRKRAMLREALVDAAGAKAAFAARRQVLQVLVARPQPAADISTVVAEPASKAAAMDAAAELDRLVFTAVQALRENEDAEQPVASAAAAGTAAPAASQGSQSAASWRTRCCRRASTAPLASRRARPSAARRASAAAMEFVKRRIQQRGAAPAPGSAVVAAHAAGITPDLVTRAAAVLTAAHDGRRDAALASRPVRRWLARGAASLLAALDARLHAVCAASEATTALVFGATSSSVVSPQALPLQPLPAPALPTVPASPLQLRPMRARAPLVITADAAAAAAMGATEHETSASAADPDSTAAKLNVVGGAPSLAAASTILAVGKSARHAQPERRSFTPAAAAGVSRPSVVRRSAVGQRYSMVPYPVALPAAEGSSPIRVRAAPSTAPAEVPAKAAFAPELSASAATAAPTTSVADKPSPSTSTMTALEAGSLPSAVPTE